MGNRRARRPVGRRAARGDGDADADPFAPRLSTAPGRGAISIFEPAEPYTSYRGIEQWIDATYVPPDDSTERGDGPNARMAIIPHDPTQNNGGGCGYSAAAIGLDTPGVVEVRCNDDEGDPISAEVVGEPLHGSAGPPAVIPDRFGWSKITVPYVPDPGFEGADCVKVTVSDGHSTQMTMLIDIVVAQQAPPRSATPPPPEVLPLPVPPRQVAKPGAPQLTDAQLAELARPYAKQVLGAEAVKRVSAPSGVQVWAPARLSKQALLRDGRAAAMLVLCPAGCRISSDSRLHTGSAKRARASSRRTTTVASAGQARLLFVALGRAERPSLRRSRSARVKLAVGIRAGAATVKTVRRSIRIS